jgi:hypothetical protein
MSFVLRNRDYYCCASYWSGAACSNEINVSRKLVEDIDQQTYNRVS